MELRGYLERLRTDFPFFVRQVFRTVSPGDEYHHNWHIDAICDVLEACRRREIRRLIINIPPRSLKSIACTIAWTAWLLGHHPMRQVMAASYSKDLSYKHSMDTRLVMRTPWYRRTFPKTIISEDQADKRKFVTTVRGQRLATSVGAATATGEGGNYLILDDPLNPEQAFSEKERQNANRWVGNTFMNRMNDKSKDVVVIIMQRLHADDVTGNRLAKGGWEHLCLPAIFKEKTIIDLGGYKRVCEKGEYLDPVRLSAEVLAEQKKEMTALDFSGQFMQDPTPDEHGILKRKHWRKWPKDEPPNCVYIVQSYDTAYEEDEQNDPTAMTTWGVFPTTRTDGEKAYGVILLDAFSERLQYPDLKPRVIKSYKFHTPDRLLIEKKSSGISLIQDLRRAKIPITAIKPGDKDKVFRANVASIVLEKGCVWYMDRDWAKEVIDECAKFPRGLHDDYVDTCVQTWIWLQRKYWLSLPEDDEEEMDIGQALPRPKRRLYGGGVTS